MNKFEHDNFYLKYKLAKKKLDAFIDILLEEYKCNNNYDLVDHTKSRLKDFDSAKEKLIKRGYEESLDGMSEEDILLSIDNNINDMVGVRIVCPFTSDVLKVIELIKEKNGDSIIIEDEGDYITYPKPSGYSSYHLDVGVPIDFQGEKQFIKCEIQVRTMAMDVWATLDHTLRYKLAIDDQDNEDDKNLIADYLTKSAQSMQGFDNIMQFLKDKGKNNNEQKVLIKK